MKTAGNLFGVRQHAKISHETSLATLADCVSQYRPSTTPPDRAVTATGNPSLPQ
jgi:hypothetical protein